MEKISTLERILGKIDSAYIPLASGLIIYVGLLRMGNYINDKSSPPLTSQEQIEGIVLRERQNHEIDKNVEITITLDERSTKGSFSRKIGDGRYEIVLHPSSGECSEKTLMHELAHIGNGDLDNCSEIRLISGFSYLFWYEPRAIWYARGSGI